MQYGIGVVRTFNGVTTLIGVYPDPIHGAYAVDKAGVRHDISLGSDNGYWASIPDVVEIGVTLADGSQQSWPMVTMGP